MYFSAYERLAAYLDRLGIFTMNPSLAAISTVLETLGLARPGFRVVQVIGTNGKGSTSAFFGSLARAHGLNTGLFTSPHFLSPRERVRVNGAVVSEADLLEAVNQVMQVGGDALSYFELLTASAMVVFRKKEVDVVILEAGLGGTWDSTTAIAADAVIFTPIDLDHQSVLGDTLAEIARDKAGAIRSSAPVVVAHQPVDAFEAIIAAADALNAPFFSASHSPLTLPEIPAPRLGSLAKGTMHNENARFALFAWRTVAPHLLPGRASEPAKEVVGLARAWIPGRVQRVAPVLGKGADNGPVEGQGLCTENGVWPCMLLDGAHNPHGMSCLGRTLAAMNTAPGAVIFTCLKDKDIDTLIPHLRVLATGPVFVPPLLGNLRALAPEGLAQRIGPQAVATASFEEALVAATVHMLDRGIAFSERNPLLICGSLYLLAEVYRLRPDCLGFA